MARYQSAPIPIIPTIQIPYYRSPKVTPIYDGQQHTSTDPLSNENSKMMKADTNEQGITCSIVLIIILAIFIILCTLAALGIDIYLLVQPQKTANSTAPIAPLRWNWTGTTVAGATGQTGTDAKFLNTPFGLAFDSSNALYIVDTLNNRTQKWPTGATAGTTVAGEANGTKGTTVYDLNYPTGIYIDSNNNMYIADTGNNRIQLWKKGTSSGQTVAGSSTGEKMKYQNPSDFFSSTLILFSKCALTGSFGPANNQLWGACAVTYDPDTDKLYIADTYNHRVMSYLMNQTSGTLILGGQGAGTNGTQLNTPIGIYFDSFTNSLFIANYGAHNIVRWSLSTNTQTVVAGNSNGLNGNTSTLLNGPVAVTIDPMGNMYVVDINNHRIQLFLVGQPNGMTTAGITGVIGSNPSLLSFPRWLILDNQLNLYVSDGGNQRVQKFSRF